MIRVCSSSDPSEWSLKFYALFLIFMLLDMCSHAELLEIVKKDIQHSATTTNTSKLIEDSAFWGEFMKLSFLCIFFYLKRLTAIPFFVLQGDFPSGSAGQRRRHASQHLVLKVVWVVGISSESLSRVTMTYVKR